MYHKMFPEEILALQQELKKHPDILKKIEGMDLGESLGSIAADLGIIMDGYYDVPDVCKLLLNKLQQKSAIVLLNSPEMNLVEGVEIREGEKSITIQQAQKQLQKPEEKK